MYCSWHDPILYLHCDNLLSNRWRSVRDSGCNRPVGLLVRICEARKPHKSSKIRDTNFHFDGFGLCVFVKVVHFVLGNVDNILKTGSALAAMRKNNYLFNRNCCRYVHRIIQARPVHSTKEWQKYTKTKQMMGHHPTDMLEIYMLTVMVLI